MKFKGTDTSNKLKSFIENPKISLWKLSIPMMLGMSVQAIYMLIDTAFIGQWVGWQALTGLGVVFPALFIIMGITFGLGSGSTTVIAQSIGEEDKEKADSFAEHTIVLGIFLSLVFIIIGVLLGEKILSSQGAQYESLKHASDYFFTMLIGTPFMILGIFFRSILSGEGDTLLPMKILGFGTILNIILDPPLIYFYQIKGAAAATVISQFIVFIIFAEHFFKLCGKHFFIFHLRFVDSIGLKSERESQVTINGLFFSGYSLANFSIWSPKFAVRYSSPVSSLGGWNLESSKKDLHSSVNSSIEFCNCKDFSHRDVP